MNPLIRISDNNKIISNFKKVVWFYDFWSWLTESKAAGKVIEFAAIRDHQKILEVACGTGVVFKQIVKRNPNGFNTGIDLSPDMLEKAKERMKKFDPKVYELKEGDVLQLDYSDNKFDILINNFMVDLMPAETFDNIASEFYRILKPGGAAVISTFSFGTRKVNKIWYWLAQRMPDLLTGCRPVSFKENLLHSGFIIEKDIQISQNTFPSEVLKVRKPGTSY